jgi:DNA polymerase V
VQRHSGIHIHTNPFREQDPQHSNSLVIPLPNASSDTPDPGARALFGLKKICHTGYAYKKAGVILMGIRQTQVAEGSLLLEYAPGVGRINLESNLPDELCRSCTGSLFFPYR